MGSIYGRINSGQQPVQRNDIEQAGTVLDHWNADRRESTIRESAGMGQLMLHNTNASLHEKLPYYEDGVLMTSDARVDNRGEICTLLGVKNDEQLYPDSYLILKLYKKYNADCIKYIIGDFAFAIWDEKIQELFCARDHMGVKPFFYSAMPGFFAFASEKKGLLCIPGVDKAIDEDYLYNYIRGSFTQSPETTLYKNIRRLPAAHILTFSAATGKFKVERYWEPDAETGLKTARDEEYIEGLRFHIEEAVRCRLRSDYEVGAELSGGLDSSGIVGVAYTLIGNKLTTFSNTLANDITDEKLLKTSEKKYIEAVIEHYDIKNKVFITEDIWNSPLEEADFLLNIDDGLEMWNPTWQLGMKQAAMHRDVRTILSGFPGDQMVTDRGNQNYLYYLDTGQYVAYWKGVKNYSDIVQRVMPFIPHTLAYGIHKTKNLFSKNKGLKMATNVFEIPVKYRLNREDTLWKNKYYKQRYRSFGHYQKARLLKPMVQLRMEAETRQGIYFRTEPRFPLADIRLIQYYLSLPAYIKCMGGMNRYMYRMAVKDYLPEMIFNRTDKVGNMAPFLFNKAKDQEKAQIMRELLQRLRTKNNLPLILKKNSNIQLFNINLFRWLELL